MKYSARFVLKWFATALCAGGALATPLHAAADAAESPPRLLAQMPSPSSPSTYSTEPGPSVTPTTMSADRETSGQRLSIESTSLESLLLEKGVITQQDWIRLKAEEERRICSCYS